MPVRRDEVQDMSAKLWSTSIQKILHDIDEQLTRSGISLVADGKITVGVHIPGNLRSTILDTYKKQGWTIKYISDQKDGDFYIFS